MDNPDYRTRILRIYSRSRDIHEDTGELSEEPLVGTLPLV